MMTACVKITASTGNFFQYASFQFSVLTNTHCQALLLQTDQSHQPHARNRIVSSSPVHPFATAMAVIFQVSSFSLVK